MVTLCWAAKGGSGTTVVVSTLALESERPSLLVDLAGEVPLMLGTQDALGPDLGDWLRGSGATAQLDDLIVDIDDHTALLGNADGRIGWAAVDAPRWQQFSEWLGEWERRTAGEVWIDAGTGDPPAALANALPRRWLVTRLCFLSLQRAARSVARPTGAVLVVEPGRTLRPADVERSLGVPIVVSIDVDPRVARSIDAGLLSSRPPAVIRRHLRKVAA